MAETPPAKKPVDLGYERTRLAADRTLMAWIRTSVSMISFGFSIYKFFQYLLESNLTAGHLQHYAPRNFGAALVGLGMILLALAIVEYFLFQRNLSRETGQKFPIITALIASLLLFLPGILVLLSTCSSIWALSRDLKMEMIYYGTMGHLMLENRSATDYLITTFRRYSGDGFDHGLIK